MLGKHASWERVRLGDIADVQNGAPYDSARFNSDGDGMPLLRIRDVGSRATQAFYTGPFTESEIVEPGALIIGMDGDFRRALWAGPPALLNQRVCRVTVLSEHVNPRFVFHVIEGYLDAVNEATPSVTVKHLSSKTVEDILLPLPPKGEQDKIVTALDDLVGRVEEAASDVRIAERALDSMRTSVLAASVAGQLNADDAPLASGEALLQGVLQLRRAVWEEAQLAAMTANGKTPTTDSWKQRYPEPVEPKAIPGVTLPHGWTWATVDQFSARVQYGTSAKTSADVTGVPVLRMGNIHEGQLRLEDLKYLPDDHHEFPELLLQPGDLLFNRTNSPELVGKSAVWRGEAEQCSFASYLIRVSVLDGVLPEYVSIFLTSNYGRAWVRSVVTQQVGQANVNGTKLRALTLPFPPTATQRAIVDASEKATFAVREIGKECGSAIVAAAALRQGVLRRAVEGELIHHDPSEESAEQTLMKIVSEAEQRRKMAPKKKKEKKPRADRAGE